MGRSRRPDPCAIKCDCGDERNVRALDSSHVPALHVLKAVESRWFKVVSWRSRHDTLQMLLRALMSIYELDEI
jgi:hypothetical protein